MKIKKSIVLEFVFLFTFLLACSTYHGPTISDNPTCIITHPLNKHEYEGRDSVFFRYTDIGGENTNIPEWSFAIIPSLEKVRLSPQITSINDNAFFSCKNLSVINLDYITIIGENCFKFSAIESLRLPKTRIINEYAFANCEKLKIVVLSNQIDQIGDFAFYSDTSLVECIIPSGKIGACAFMGCSKLERLSIDSITIINRAAFLDCRSLSSITIPPTVLEIGDLAFSGCDNLKNITVCSRKTKISDSAFDKNIQIKYIEDDE